MKWLAVAIVALILFVAVIAAPDLLATNAFINELASHELVSVLVVILTVTMASVANIHLALGRLKKKFKENGNNIDGLVKEARKELSENAWYLFGAFCILIIVLVIKGSAATPSVIAICHAIALLILTLNLVILYDIYKSVYLLTSLDEPAHPGQAGDDGSDVRGDHHGP